MDPAVVFSTAGTVTVNMVPPADGVPPKTCKLLKVTTVPGTKFVPVNCNVIGSFVSVGELTVPPVKVGTGFMTVKGSEPVSAPAGSFTVAL